MPRITDYRLKDSKHKRNETIREYFATRLNNGVRLDAVIDEAIGIWGLSESTLNQIIKGYGGYKHTSNN